MTIPQLFLGDHGEIEDLLGGWRGPLEAEERWKSRAILVSKEVGIVTANSSVFFFGMF